ncbi:Sapep family Mn(2+)-dependent dipeptidase [Companilactobacillus furfuricola]|uniref:Sapep family Mn(2+)-dependent dipeptidase n=1 Tax=Companilactobacillus furfuricola TaxID=1462575 RepID=UPI000F786BB7|nr:Sapep family Mn(2+)-dependent dipeptidase [Companilactobacillus furfuricola]
MIDFISDSVLDSAVASLEKLVAVPSFNTEDSGFSGAPFGAGPRAALDSVLEIAADLGFATFCDPDGYYGYADVGSGDSIFGIVCHVDTVPAGDASAWSFPPFELHRSAGVLYGRGVQDDKGPTVAALFAVKAILDAGFSFDRKIRFIFGTDEEILWRCLAEYNKKEVPIDLGIAPDAEFPLIYAEKGLQQSYLVGEGSSELFVDVVDSFNAVPSAAFYDGPKLAGVKQALKEHDFDFLDDDPGLTVVGRSVHAMNAPFGVNAIDRLAIALADVFPEVSVLQFFKKYGEEAHGFNLLGDVSDEVSGQLTFNISSLQIDPAESKIQIDLRIPVTVDHDELIAKLSRVVAPFNLKYVDFDYLKPLYVKTDSYLVKTLMASYQAVSKDMTSKPQISGGATFARTMPNTVAFGAMLPTTPDHMHQVDERWSLADMKLSMKILAEAVYRLCVK